MAGVDLIATKVFYANHQVVSQIDNSIFNYSMVAGCILVTKLVLLQLLVVKHRILMAEKDGLLLGGASAGGGIAFKLSQES